MAKERMIWERLIEEEREKGREAVALEKAKAEEYRRDGEEAERGRGEKALERAVKLAETRHEKELERADIWHQKELDRWNRRYENERVFWGQQWEKEREKWDQERSRFQQENANAWQLVLKQRDKRRDGAGQSDVFRALSGNQQDPANFKKRSASG